MWSKKQQWFTKSTIYRYLISAKSSHLKIEVSDLILHTSKHAYSKTRRSPTVTLALNILLAANVFMQKRLFPGRKKNNVMKGAVGKHFSPSRLFLCPSSTHTPSACDQVWAYRCNVEVRGQSIHRLKTCLSIRSTAAVAFQCPAVARWRCEARRLGRPDCSGPTTLKKIHSKSLTKI